MFLFDYLIQLLKPVVKSLIKANVFAKLKRLGVYCSPSVVIQFKSWDTLFLGKNIHIGHGSVIVVSDEKSMQGVSSWLKIGDGTAINEYVNIRAAGGQIVIGKNCMIAQFVSIIASNHRIDCSSDMIKEAWVAERNGVSIGDNVWIGAGSIILPGVRIGNGSVIGAGSVVTHDVGVNDVVAGVPAKVIRKRNIS